MKQLLMGALTAATILSAGRAHDGVAAAEKLQLTVSPTISMAPASVIVRAIVERDPENRMLEIVADSYAFYRRTVLELDGAKAPKVNELRLIDIPGGEYEVRATLYDSRGGRTDARRVLMVMAANNR